MTRKGTLTAPRRTILEIVSSSADHPTAADIIDRLKSRGCTFAYATVYNSLRYLTEEGLLREVKLTEGASRYDARLEEHQHIVCSQCGRVDEVFTLPAGDWLERIAADTGYQIEQYQLILKGACSSCQIAKTTTPMEKKKPKDR